MTSSYQCCFSDNVKKVTIIIIIPTLTTTGTAGSCWFFFLIHVSIFLLTLKSHDEHQDHLFNWKQRVRTFNCKLLSYLDLTRVNIWGGAEKFLDWPNEQIEFWERKASWSVWELFSTLSYIALLEMFIIVTLEKAKKNLVGGVSYQEDIKLAIRLNCRQVKIDASQKRSRYLKLSFHS